MDAVIPMRDERTRLLRINDVMRLTGLGRENATALVRVYGIKFGRCYYIKREWLDEALEERRKANEQLVDGG